MPTVIFYETTENGSEVYSRIALRDGKLVVLEGPPRSVSAILSYANDPRSPKDLPSLMRTMPLRYDGGYLRAEYIEEDSGLTEGGPGSGHHGHAGRPGEIGGSVPGPRGGASSAAPPGQMANPDGKDTQQQYQHKDGTWTAERQALHNKIVTKFFEGKTPVSNPQSFIMGGGPAAGKTTLLNSGQVDIPENHVLAAGDDIKAMLPEYDGGKGAGYVHEESSYLSKAIASRAAAESYNVLMDGTGDGGSESLTRKVASMSPLGQPVHGIYVTVDVETAVTRNIARAKRTGRYLPESVLRSSHAGVAKAFPDAEYRDLFTTLRLYDTNDKVKLIASETGGKLSILDQAAYDKFLSYGE